MSEQPSLVLSNVLITGAAGFIGRRVTQRLLDDGYNVTAVDDLSGGLPWAFPAHPRLTCVQLDVGDHDRMRTLCRDADPQAVVHLAARHYIPYCRAHPEETDKCNVGGTRSLLRSLNPRHPLRIVFASTAAVYPPAAGASREDAPPYGGDIYADTKRRAELLLSHYRSLQPASRHIRIARIFNVFGPGDGNPHLIPEILDQMCRSDTIRLGNLHTQRDYCYVDDVVDVLVYLTVARDAPPILNVGSGIPRSAQDIVQSCESLTGRRLNLVSTPERHRPCDRQALYADTSLLHAVLPNLASDSFQEYLGHTLSERGLLNALPRLTS